MRSVSISKTDLDAIVKAAMATQWFNLSDDAINLAAEEPDKGRGVKVFLGEVEQTGVKDVVLVVLDTWARMLWAAGGHDSDQQTVGPSVAGCDYIRRELNCAVIMVAHIGTGKDSQKRAKGLSDPTGAVDGATRCWKVGEGPDAAFHYQAAYQRFAAEGFQLNARMRPQGPAETLSFYKAEVTTKPMGKLTKRQRAVLEILNGLPDGTSEADWQAAVEAGDIINARGGGPAKPDSVRRVFRTVMSELERLDRISIVNRMVYRNDAAPDFVDDARADLEDEDDLE